MQHTQNDVLTKLTFFDIIKISFPLGDSLHVYEGRFIGKTKKGILLFNVKEKVYPPPNSPLLFVFEKNFDTVLIRNKNLKKARIEVVKHVKEV